MPLSLNKQYTKVLLVAMIAWAQKSSKSELQLESYLDFTTRAKLMTKS
jgi:hypothetical protein